MFSAETPELTLTTIQSELACSSSSAFDIVDSLCKIGLLQRIDRGRYRLGPFVATLNRSLRDTSMLIEASRPELERLLADHGETLHVSVLDHMQITIAESREGTRPLKISRDFLGARMPLHEAPTGLLHLAFASMARRDAYWAQAKGSAMPLLPVDRREADLASYAEAGLCVGSFASERDIVGIAAIIRNHADVPHAALTMSVPKSRYDTQPRAFQATVVEAAQKISNRMGGVVTISRNSQAFTMDTEEG
ncbi:Acetate operon repressor (plasmid) [Marinibacterium anthonyi]|nr:Acetate operon repressor [Marinibacterium anthonyi]